MNLAQLQARLKEIGVELEALTKKDTLTADDLTAITKLTDEAEAAERNIETLLKAEQVRARAALPANAPANEERALVHAEPAEKFTAAEKVGFLAVAVVKAKLDGGGSSPKAVLKVLDENGYGFLAKEFSKSNKAMNAGSQSAGGIFVPDEIANEVVPLLRPNTTFLQGNPRRVAFDRGNYHVPAAASGATAYWRGEGRPIPPSQPTFVDINLSAKLLGSLVPITDQLLRWSRIDIREWVERDMSQAMGQEVDRAAYFGAGTINEPQGILNITGVGSTAASGGTTPTVAQIEANASTLELNMMMTNLPMNGAAWVMSPRTMIFLQNLRDGNGNRYFPELQLASPIWRNKPVLLTTTYPVNLGVGTNESVLALINFGDVYYGESRSLSFAVSNEATYVKNGVVVSAFQNGLTLIKAETEVDVGVRYLQAVQKLTAIQWGG
jgi:HK97 family phage major capsid protein